ncbi:MAG: bifunctional UDP-N-acetylglucosamine diphosphorylase/glucosamine-1-phosphate N-acetyltransferase GlmU [Pseudomonadota bacterium]|nr:bifunctional UDP-N-acetylglucosamine diphosphorylase/glucosamine-1-phosphate N-acetyltransferase GlmU [Pseudomonadota bacterium]
MSKKNTAVIVLAAGLGMRMKSTLPKVLHPIAGRAMILQLLDSLTDINPNRIVLVIGPNMELVSETIAAAGYDVEVIIQNDRLGTGHAVAQTKKVLSDFRGEIVVLYGDSPLIKSKTLFEMLEARANKRNPAVVVLGFRPFDSAKYGRLILGKDGNLEAIIEAADASEEELSNNLCNSGVMVIDSVILFDLISNLSNNNSKGEFYLTDIIRLSGQNGRHCIVVEGEEEELLGINSRSELAFAESIIQDRLRKSAMENGATLIDPSSIYFSYDTKVGRDVTIGPNVFFGPGVEVCDGAVIRSFCHIEGTFINKNAIIGPFARLRPGANIGEDVHIGNFVEVKNASLAAGVKANHLAYIGDTQVGKKANIGAGTITCNYDGYKKSITEIGAGAFIGSNTALVAPVKIGKNSITGAGSVITKNVESGALAITRAEQKVVKNFSEKSKETKVKE